MAETITIQIDGVSVSIAAGTSVAAALLQNGRTSFRKSVAGQNRAPLCGMGICYECRVTINGQPHCRSCQILCQNGMVISADE